MSLDLTTYASLSPIRREFAPSLVNYKKGALDSQPQVIKFTSCLPRVGGSLRVLPPASSTTKTGRHDIAEILLRVALNTKIQIQIYILFPTLLLIQWSVNIALLVGHVGIVSFFLRLWGLMTYIYTPSVFRMHVGHIVLFY